MSTFWEFFVNHLESIAFWISIIVAVSGLLAVLIVWRRWTWLESHYQEIWPKCAVAFFRAVAALAAVAAKPVPFDTKKSPWEQPWAPTIVIAVAGYLLWEIAGARGDQMLKRSKEKSAEEYQQQIEIAYQDRDDARLEALRLGWLLTHLRKLVSKKCERIRDLTRVSENAKPTIQQARDGFAPLEHVQILLEWLASLFHLAAIHLDSRRHNQNFRVGLYTEHDGRLVPLDAFDLATCRHDPFSSYLKHVDRFRLNNDTNPSHAVRSLHEGKTLIVEDCTLDPAFEFFHDRQTLYLRSMIAHPLLDFRLDGLTPVRSALVIDTDVAGFFREDDREILELLLREFVVRLDLEYSICRLTGIPVIPKGGADE